MNEEKLVNTTITEQATNGVVKTSITEPKPNEGTQSATVVKFTKMIRVTDIQMMLDMGLILKTICITIALPKAQITQLKSPTKNERKC